MKRGFRFQTGELDAAIKEMSEKGFTQVDIDDDHEIADIMQALVRVNAGYEKYQQLLRVDEMAHEPEFHSRLVFHDGKYIDLFHMGESEETYDEIFWG